MEEGKTVVEFAITANAKMQQDAQKRQVIKTSLIYILKSPCFLARRFSFNLN
jgi:hypothetical protein